MTTFEDNFSRQAREYALHRPRYPRELFGYLASIAPRRRLAWDCGTGNGQAALGLAEHFDRVVATDASAEQIRLAVPHQRIEYRAEAAEDVSLDPRSTDLVTVATAAHWFDLERFYARVRGVTSPRGILAVWTYHAALIEPRIDRVLERYHDDTVGAYWPDGFRHVIAHYRTLPFPFEEIAPPPFEMRTEWTLDQLLGFVGSWSATQRYRRERGEDPLASLRPALVDAWDGASGTLPVRWPLHLRVGRVR